MRLLPAVFAAVTSMLAAPPAQTAPDGIEWHTDFAAARALAAERHAPLFVTFRCER